MKKPILLFTLLSIIWSLTGALRSQEVATLIGKPTLQSTIVRQFGGDTNIHYCNDIYGNHYFVLKERTHPDSAIVAEFPNDMEVHDFEINKNTIYFCGTSPNGGNPWGIVGKIDIGDLFYGNGSYNIGITPYSFYRGNLSSEHLTSCDRMDLFEYGGFVHMAIVGEMAHGFTYNNLRRTAADIWFDGTNWTGAMLYQKEDFYKTSDITCTNHYIVVSAYDTSSSYSLLLLFDKQANFPTSPTFPYSIKIYDRRADNNILVERLQSDNIAVAHYFYDTATLEYGTAVHYISHVSLLPSPPLYFSLHYPHSRTIPRAPLIDLRYNKPESSLMLLLDIEAPLWTTWRSTIFDFDISNLTSLTARAWHYYDNVSLLTLDNRSPKYCFSVGGNYNPTGEPVLTMRDKSLEGCYQHLTFSYLNVTPNVVFSTGPFEDAITNPFFGGRPSLPNPITRPVNIICE